MTISMYQPRWVMSALEGEVKNLDRYEPGDPAPYVNLRPWGAQYYLAREYTGDDPRKRREQRELNEAVKHTLKRLADEGEITLYKADGIIAGVWLGQPMGNRRASIPVRDRELIMERDEYECVLCGATEHLTIDHIFPVAHGGSGDPINLRVLCRSCNSAKGASLPDEIRLLGKPPAGED